MRGAAAKTSMVVEKQGSSEIKATTKMAGKALYVDVYSLSGDGKTLTDNGSAVAVSETAKMVYERQ